MAGFFTKKIAMPVSILQHPLDIDYSRHPIVLTVQASAEYIASVQGNNADGHIDIPDTTQAWVGNTITVSWNAESVTLTAAAAPIPNDGLHFLENSTGALSPTDYIDDLVDRLNGNFALSQVFTITAIVGGVNFVSTMPVENFNLSTTIGLASAVIVNAGSLASPLPNYKIRCDVYARPETASFQRVAQLVLAPLTSGSYQSDFVLNDIIDAQMEPPPPGATGLPSPYFAMQQQYYCRLTEMYGVPAVAHLAVTSDTKRAVKGGVNRQNYVGYSNMINPSGAIDGQDLFLTYKPISKFAHPDNLEYLCWYHHKPTGTGNIVAQLTLNDGTNVTVTLSSFTLTQYYMYALPAGFFQLSLAGSVPPGLHCVSWAVWLSYNSVSITSRHKYVIPQQCPEKLRHLIWYNSLGGYDTVHLFENTSYGVKTERDMAERNMLFQNYNLGNQFAQRKRTAQTFKVSTGWVSEEYAAYLVELFRSRWVWEPQPPFNPIRPPSFRPVVIISDSVETYRDGLGSLNRVAFEYAYAWEDSV